MNKKTYYTFNDPHPTGGDSKVKISRTAILEWMRNRYKELLKDLSEEKIVEEFCLLYGAWKTPDDKTLKENNAYLIKEIAKLARESIKREAELAKLEYEVNMLREAAGDRQ